MALNLNSIAQGLLGAVFAVRVFDGTKPWWSRAGYALVAADCFSDVLKDKVEQRELGAVGSAGSAPSALSALSKPLQFQAHTVRTLQDRVAYIHKQMIQGTRDPKVYELARSVVSKRNADGSWAVPEKDNWAEAQALFNEVRKRVRYVFDPIDYDAFQTARRTLEMNSGDCDDYSSLLGAMCRSVGLNVRTRVVQTKDSDTWNHIYLVVNIGGTWKALDASMAKPAGWEVPKDWVTKVQDFEVVE